MNQSLMMAVLSLHAYDERVTVNKIGNATVVKRAEPSDGFDANRYSYNGQTVVAFRGTDGFADLDDWMGGVGWLTPQSALAADFYRDGLTGDNIYGSNTIFTGHSLGGGLAGLLGSIYGKQAFVFDEMGFTSSATNLQSIATNPLSVSQQYILNTYYGQNNVNVLSTGSVGGYQLQGQALQSIGQSTSAVVGAGTEFDLSPMALHGMALLVAMIYEKDFVTDKYWHNIAHHFGQAWASDNDRATRIAYSVVDEGEMVNGNSAIVALFNDTNDIGRHASAALATVSGNVVVTVDSLLGSHFAMMATEYADGLAEGKILKNSTVEKGVFQSDTGYLAVSLDAASAAWTSALVKTALSETRLSVNHLLSIAPEFGVTPDLTAEVKSKVDQSQLLIIGNAGNASVDSSVSKFSAGYHFSGSGDPRSVLLGTASNNKLAGGDADDLIVGGGGNDVLVGGKGKDILLGGKGDDILFGGDMTLVDGNEFETDYNATNWHDGLSNRLIGGEGNDIYVPQWASTSVLKIPIYVNGNYSQSFLTSLMNIAPKLDVISDSDGQGIISPYPWPNNIPPKLTWRPFVLTELDHVYRNFNIQGMGWDFAGRNEGAEFSQWLGKIVNGELIVCMIQQMQTGYGQNDTRDITLWFNYKMDAGADFLQPGGTGGMRIADSLAALTAGSGQPVGSYLGMRFTMAMNQVLGTVATDTQRMSTRSTACPPSTGSYWTMTFLQHSARPSSKMNSV